MSSSSLERPGCPDENALAAYVEASLDDRRAAEIEEHLDSCSACRRVAASVARALGEGGAVDATSRPTQEQDVQEVLRLQEDARARIRPGQTIGRYSPPPTRRESCIAT
jgi:predicted anti-sigma-YlaC factor YlaD